MLHVCLLVAYAATLSTLVPTYISRHNELTCLASYTW